MEYYDYRHSGEYYSESNSSGEEVLEEEEEIIDGRESNQHSPSPLPPQRLNRVTGNPGITAFIDAVTLGPDDVEIYAYNKKELASGSTLLPIAIRTKRAILEAASPILRGKVIFLLRAYIHSSGCHSSHISPRFTQEQQQANCRFTRRGLSRCLGLLPGRQRPRISSVRRFQSLLARASNCGTRDSPKLLIYRIDSLI